MSFHDELQSALGAAFVLERELGGGGMSRVFVAEERALRRKVVVKVLPRELLGSLSIERFKREVALVAILQHPHIVPLLTTGETRPGGTESILYYTMPFVDGETLRDRLRRAPIGVNESIRILREVTTALAYAHSRLIVHRDIKPENILLSGGVAAVTDFGVAKALQAAASPGENHLSDPLTSYGVALGTPTYMAPEQAAADPLIDHRADLYALGCLAYEMLSGAPPFVGSSQRVLASHVTQQPSEILTARPDLPVKLASLVMRCLAKDPDARPHDANQVLDLLDDLMEAGGNQQSASEFLSSSARRRLLSGIVALLALSVIALVTMRLFARSGAMEDGPPSIGVVSFDNLSTERENEYFSEGITQEIADALGKVPGLKVAVQRSGAAERTMSTDPRRIGKTLGVKTVVLGSVQRVGSRVHLMARLVNVDDGSVIWSDKYDRELKDVFAAQDELARAIVDGLQVRLVGGSRSLVRAATADPEAHRLYLQGMYYWNRRSIPSLHKALETFAKAIGRDPSYAAPYAGLALTWAVLPSYEDVDVSAASDSALAAGRAALARDSTSTDAWTAIGEAESNRWKNAEALAAFARAVALDSNNARARQWYGELLADVGHFREARQQLYRARDLEPLTLTINANVGRVEMLSRRYHEAEVALRHTLELDSTFQTAHNLLSNVLLAQGRTEEAVSEYEVAVKLTGGRRPSSLALLGHVYARSGRRREAEAILSEVEQRKGTEKVSLGALSLLLDALGHRDRAVAAFGSAVQQFDAIVRMNSRSAIFDSLRQDSRTTPFFARVEAGG